MKLAVCEKEMFERSEAKHIDYVSLDVEGFELKALKGIDFDKVTRHYCR